jgi:hypothetical protein
MLPFMPPPGMFETLPGGFLNAAFARRFNKTGANAGAVPEADEFPDSPVMVLRPARP